MERNEKVLIKSVGMFLFILMLLTPFVAGTCFAQNVYMAAETFTYQNTDPAAPHYSPALAGITMWGYVLTDSAFTPLSGETPKVPGPTLTVAQGATLNIHLKNNLPAAAPGVFTEPTSVIIPGQNAALAPVWFNPATGAVFTGSRPTGDVTSRVRSLTKETPVGGIQIYTWTGVKAGTYLYQSGTHPAVQVQMGLYGALIVNSDTANQAYNNASTAYDSQTTLVFSEIDTELHYSIASGLYGIPPPPPPATPVRGQRTSAEEYHPNHFLINGEPFSYGLTPILAGNPGRVLLRFLNAGLLEKSPTLQTPGQHMTILAEDGNLLPYSKQQYSSLLPAGKTMDAIITPPAAGYIALYDRSLNLADGARSPGGMLRYLQVASPTQVTLTINRIGVGTLIGAGVVQATSLPAGIDCGTGGFVCTQSYNSGTLIRLTATWKNGSAFLGWGGACTGTQRDCILTLTGNTTVAAAFEPTLVGVFRSGAWYLDRNGNGQWNGCATDLCVAAFGGFVGDIPIAGDWTGLDGRAKIGTYRQGEWFLDTNGNGAWDPGIDTYIPAFGGFPGDIPVTGDWNGTGIVKIGTYRNGEWFLDTNGNGVWDPGVDRYIPAFGGPGDIPIIGAWGGGVPKIGIYRNGAWFLDANDNGVWDPGIDTYIPAFGGFPGDIPVTGDWNGTGIMKIGVYRHGEWFLDTNGNGVWDPGADRYIPDFGGLAVDIPVTGAW